MLLQTDPLTLNDILMISESAGLIISVFSGSCECLQTLRSSCGSETQPASGYQTVAGSIPLACVWKCPWAEPQTGPGVLVGTIRL